MAASKHTPGPWQYENHSPNRIMTTNNATVAAVYGGFVGTAEQVSNVRLITAAPTMYEYIAKRAVDGDQDAEAIIGDIESPGPQGEG